MRLLAIDTSGPYGAVGLIENGRPIGDLQFHAQEHYSVQLLPAIESVLKNAGLSPSDIDAFGVVLGPGSFTGLRVGLASIKALAWANDKPIVGINALEVLAQNLRSESALLAPMLDARKQRVFGAIYRWRNDSLETLRLPVDILPVDLLDGIREPIICFGSGARTYRATLETLKCQIEFAPESADRPRGMHVARVAWQGFERGERLDLNLTEPLYMRATEAEMKEMKEKKLDDQPI